MAVKQFSGYIVVDWRLGGMKLRKERPRLNPYEVAVMFNMSINVPDAKIPQVNLEVEVPLAAIETVTGDATTGNLSENIAGTPATQTESKPAVGLVEQ